MVCGSKDVNNTSVLYCSMDKEYTCIVAYDGTRNNDVFVFRYFETPARGEKNARTEDKEYLRRSIWLAARE